MIIANDKPLALVGYKNSISVREIQYALSVENPERTVSVIDPDSLFQNADPTLQYLNVAVNQNFIMRRKVTAFLNEHNLDRFTYIHNSSIIHVDVCNLAPGTIIGPATAIAFDVTTGRDSMILGQCGIGHGSSIGEGTYISGGVFLGGSVTIGAFCFLGIRSTIYDKVTICDDVVVSASSTVRKDITEPGMYHGFPAKKMRSFKQ